MYCVYGIGHEGHLKMCKWGHCWVVSLEYSLYASMFFYLDFVLLMLLLFGIYIYFWNIFVVTGSIIITLNVQSLVLHYISISTWMNLRLIFIHKREIFHFLITPSQTDPVIKTKNSHLLQFCTSTDLFWQGRQLS